MPNSKFARQRPKYTPPKVCKKSAPGGAFDLPDTPCPSTGTLTATIFWPPLYWPMTGAPITTFQCLKQQTGFCNYVGTETTRWPATLTLQIYGEPSGTTARVSAFIDTGTTPVPNWVQDPLPWAPTAPKPIDYAPLPPDPPSGATQNAYVTVWL